MIQAKYIQTIFHNEQNGYTVAKFETYDKKEEAITVVGFTPGFIADAIYDLHGDFIEHSRFGMQFQLSSYEIMKPSDKEALIRFFSSDLFPGIGKKTAEAIVEVVGEQGISKIMDHPDILDQVPVLSLKKKELIIANIDQFHEQDDLVGYLMKYGISVRNIMKIDAIYKEQAIAIIQENPYKLMEDIDGIGFKTVDHLAQQMQFPKEHPYRIRAIILNMIYQAMMQTGNTYMLKTELLKALDKQLMYDIDVDSFLEDLILNHQIIIEEDRIYHHTQFQSELGIAKMLNEFPYQQMIYQDVDLEAMIHVLEKELNITYEQKQKEAIEIFFKESFTILTGGPGTGKTTIVRAIIDLYKQIYPNHKIACVAPTGRASKRLSELSHGESTTIHSLLKWDLETNTFGINAEEPLEIDLLIIDEFSMVDQWLFYNLLAASTQVSKILIIGDNNQIPSVGPGKVLKDLIDSHVFATICLEKIFRQNEGSDVITLAHDIKEDATITFSDMKDIAFFELDSIQVKNQIAHIIDNAFTKGYSEYDIQVLAPMYQGVAGIDNLNNTLQKIMNPQSDEKRELKVGHRTFRENDKVLQLKNQPEENVYNGDIGKIVDIRYASEDELDLNCITVDFGEAIVEYRGELLYNLTHAYCISIHKSQGSEYAIVIMPIVKEHQYMLQKRLIYTGITRAKRSLILLGNQDLFQASIHLDERMPRKSTLKERLLKIMEVEDETISYRV